MRPDVPAAVRGDPLRLRQVLANLVGNAIKFTERGEVVACGRAGRDDARPTSADARAFDVRDTGIGIAPTRCRALFSASPRPTAARRAATAAPGSGWPSPAAGRADGRQHRRRERSRASARSSSSTCRLPAARTSAAVGCSMPPNLAHLRVLVVDDHETNRTVLEHMLDAWGMDVTLAEDGQQALEILRGKTVLRLELRPGARGHADAAHGRHRARRARSGRRQRTRT